MDREAVRRAARPELSWKSWDEVLHDRSRNLLFNYLGLGEDNVAIRPSPRLRRLRLLFARLFRIQDGAAVRLFELLARHSAARRRSATSGSMWSTPRSPAQRRRPSRTPRPNKTPRPRPQPSLSQLFSRPQQAAPPAIPPAPKRLGLASAFARYLPDVADVVQTGAVRVSATDDKTDFYTVPLTQATLRPGTVYADPYGHVLMLVQRVPEVERRAGRLPRRRCGARRDGHAQAILARQFPVRARSRARQPRLQALPADRAREERRLAAADQCRNRERPAVRRLFARAVAAQRPGLLRSHGRRDVARAARSGAGDGGRHHRPRRAGEDARHVGRKRAKISETARPAKSTCRPARRSSRRPARGRIIRPRRAIFVC